MKTKLILMALLCSIANLSEAQNNRFLIAGNKPKPNAFAVIPPEILYNPDEITTEQLKIIKKENHSIWLIAYFDSKHGCTQPQVSLQDTATAFVFIPPRYQGNTLTLSDDKGQTIETLPVNGMLYTVYYAKLPEGVYFITLYQDGKPIYQNKIIKIQ